MPEADAKKKPLKEKYGFDIVYDPAADAFALQLRGTERSVILHSGNIDYKTWQNNYVEDLKETFNKPTEYTTVEEDLYEAVEDTNGGIALAYYDMDNGIVINKYTISDEDRVKLVDMLIENGKTPDDANHAIDRVLNQSPDELRYIIEHEVTHLEDHKYFDNEKCDLPPQYMAKLNMMTEIKANMKEAGLALQQYQKNGDLSGFDYLSFASEAMKKGLQENYDLQNPQGVEAAKNFVAESVYNNWLQTFNCEGSYYSNQSYVNALAGERPVWALVDGKSCEAEYKRRIDAMFQDVGYLGDVRKYVNADLKLNNELTQAFIESEMQNAALKAIMKRDAENAKKYSKNLQRYMKKVKKIDRDNVRTDKETQKLSKYIEKSISICNRNKER